MAYRQAVHLINRIAQVIKNISLKKSLENQTNAIITSLALAYP